MTNLADWHSLWKGQATRRHTITAINSLCSSLNDKRGERKSPVVITYLLLGDYDGTTYYFYKEFI
ncbi:hypothetical protein [Spirosoma jeollabukense]